MSIFYLDTSAIVKCYTVETGTAWVRSLTSLATGHELYTARIASVEAVAALTRRAKRHSGLTQANIRRATQTFRADFPARYLPVEMTEPLLNHAMTIAERYGLRGYDAVHLAAAVEIQAQTIVLRLPSIVLISADSEMNAAAAQEGLLVDHPDLHP